MANVNVHGFQQLKLVVGYTECCEEFPHCEHNTWQAVCPSCESSVKSVNFLGPYHCGGCGQVFYPLVEGWSDCRED